MSEDFVFDIDQIERRMKNSVNALNDEMSGLRAGRADPALLESIIVDAYGTTVPLSQISTVSAAGPRMLSVNVWDATLAPVAAKAIENASLGLNPMTEGTVIRVPLPDLTRERRQELAKAAARAAENARVALRNIRRDGMSRLKRAEKEKAISEDQHARFSKDLQLSTDKFVAEVDTIATQKERDIMAV